MIETVQNAHRSCRISVTYAGRVYFELPNILIEEPRPRWFPFVWRVFRSGLYLLVWLGGRVVRALDLRSTGRGFDSRPPRFRVQSLASISTHVPPSLSSISWYRSSLSTPCLHRERGSFTFTSIWLIYVIPSLFLVSFYYNLIFLICHLWWIDFSNNNCIALSLKYGFLSLLLVS